MLPRSLEVSQNVYKSYQFEYDSKKLVKMWMFWSVCSWEQQTSDSHLHACQIKVFEGYHRLSSKIPKEWSLENMNQDEKISSSVTVTKILHGSSRINRSAEGLLEDSWKATM